jgi:hypothetical protein
MAIWNILQAFGKFYDHLLHFVFIWYIFPVLVSCTKKNLAILITAISHTRIFLLRGRGLDYLGAWSLLCARLPIHTEKAAGM